MSKTDKAISAARAALRRKADKACIARGEALWTNGYRHARTACGAESESEDNRLYHKEMSQFRQCDVAEKKLDRAITAYALAIRRSFDPIKRRGRR